MAYIPENARLIDNPVSAAPGFKIKNVWVMAGVPKIMQSMFLESVEPKLKKGKIIFSKSIKVISLKEILLKLLIKLIRSILI